jgi:F-type H+-transporting ATPase subunit epsilon
MKVIVSKIDKVLFEGEAKELQVPGVDGDMTILSHHSALVTTLRKGKVRVRQGDTEESWEIEKGILEVANDTATVLL